MFMQRFITSVILIPIVLALIFFAQPWFIADVILVLLLLMGTECCQLIPLKSLLLRTGFLLLLLVLLVPCYYWFDYWLSVGLILWLLCCVAILTYPASQRYWGHPPVVAVLLWVFLPLFAFSFKEIYFFTQGKALIVYLFCLVWAADIGAYLIGKYWGKHKLIPKVSPGKSWEGVLGGVILSMLVTAVGLFYFTPYSYLLWFFWSMLTVILSIFGDLLVSMFKRRCQLKDTGTLIYGHGGILDRLDSLIAAAPIFYLGLSYIPLGI